MKELTTIRYGGDDPVRSAMTDGEIIDAQSTDAETLQALGEALKSLAYGAPISEGRDALLAAITVVAKRVRERWEEAQ